MDVSKLLLNPARFRIWQYMRCHTTVRTSDIVENLRDIPRATVYHHVKLLEDHKIIRVVEENRIRGAVEKVYTLKDDSVLEGEGLIALSTAFHLELLQEMNEYLEEKGEAYKQDTVFFSSSMLQVTEDEYQTLLQSISDLLVPYADRLPSPEYELRKLSLISSPPVKQEKAKKRKK